MSSEVDFQALARRTPGFSGADLTNVINEAPLLAVREGKLELEPRHLEQAVNRLIVGAGRRPRALGSEELWRAAYHEAGHAVVAATLGVVVHRASVLGHGAPARQLRAEAAFETRRDLQRRLVVLLAGLAAEELALGDCSTGCEQDLEAATSLARDMVTRYGMSPLGRPRLAAATEDAFLDEAPPLGALSPHTHRRGRRRDPSPAFGG